MHALVNLNDRFMSIQYSDESHGLNPCPELSWVQLNNICGLGRWLERHGYSYSLRL